MAKQRKYAHRTELLERNPDLNKNWLTRALVAVIVGGASIHPNDWPQVRFGIFFSPVIILVFSYNVLYDHELAPYKYVISLILIISFTAGLPLLLATAYGYWKRDSIDTSGSLKPNYGYLKRYAFLWVMIGVGVSTGFGMFAAFTGK